MITLKYDDVKSILKKRNKNSHKGDYGKCLIIGSSKRYIGAGVICANACMRSGSGLVTLAVEDDIYDVVSQKLTEVMPLDVSIFGEDFEKLVESCDAIAVGCGLGIRDYTLDKIKYVLENSKCNIVFDADALNVISKNMHLINDRKNKNTMIFTPHEGEFARLSGYDIDYIKNHRIDVCTEFSNKYENVILILKGAQTIISSKSEIFMCDIGVPEMATGGMGDCLCGMITSFLGQSYTPIDACKIGVFFHSYIANMLSKKMNSVLASDVINQIPYTLKIK